MSRRSRSGSRATLVAAQQCASSLARPAEAQGIFLRALGRPLLFLRVAWAYTAIGQPVERYGRGRRGDLGARAAMGRAASRGELQPAHRRRRYRRWRCPPIRCSPANGICSTRRKKSVIPIFSICSVSPVKTSMSRRCGIWDSRAKECASRLLDSGIQVFHPDLLANLNPTLRFNAITGTNNPSPTINDVGSEHGTAVAGLIGAAWNNGIGGTGVAPNVDIVPIKMLGTGQTTRHDFVGLSVRRSKRRRHHEQQLGSVAQVQSPRTISGLTPAEFNTLRDSVVFGRDGLGMIHVFASGNNGGPSFSPGFQGFGN